MSLFMKLPDAGVMHDGYVTLPIRLTSSQILGARECSVACTSHRIVSSSFTLVMHLSNAVMEHGSREPMCVPCGIKC